MEELRRSSSQTTSLKPLGELLVEKGLITSEQLQEALTYQRSSGSLLGEIIVSRGWVKPFLLYQVIAEQTNYSYAGHELQEIVNQVDRALLDRFSPEQMSMLVFFPLQSDSGKTVVLTAFPDDPELNTLLQKEFSESMISKKLATPYEVDWLINFFYRDAILSEATTGLFFRHPEESAMRVFTGPQIIVFFLCAALLLFWFFFKPNSALLFLFIIINVFYFVNIMFKFVLSLAGSQQEAGESITEEDLRQTDSEKLPIYTVLLPLYREPREVIHQLTQSIKQFDYPTEKLDVIYLIEEDDQETLEICRQESPPYIVRFLVIPKGLPKTKPRACNYGLAFARGEFLTIYDAEDMPEPTQLKKAVVAFWRYPGDYACFQAALNYYNQNQNILTRLFTLEYSYWFDFMLPGLFALRLPIPLGGTSNHFRTDLLRELGGWDPFNVTEDADLGMRASYRGYRVGVFSSTTFGEAAGQSPSKVGVLNSTTFEEANSRTANWIRQRSRWLKGYLQTFLVHNRHPFHVVKASGWKGWFTLQFFIGGTTIGQAASLVLWGLFFFWLITRAAAFGPQIPASILYIGAFNLFFGNFLGVYLSMIAVFRRRLYHLTVYALLNPLYWLLASIAAWKAIIQLFSRPFYWEKTTHGLGQKGNEH